ncbi:MAG: hypothetical protein ABI604_13090 [Nitrospirota bacterium]
MKKLTPLLPYPLYVDRFIEIRDRKHHAVRTKLVGIHLQISNQYQALEAAAASTSLQTLVPDPVCAGVSDTLRACYEGPTKALIELKAAIKSTQPPRLLKYCPMCGTTIDSTFDHYVPITDFPEFAVHPLNLVPCCGTCNSTKSDNWLDVTGNRQYLHSYTDSLPDVTILSATLHESPGYTAVGATFALVRPNLIDNSIWEVIESHFQRLHLLDRYDNLSNDEIAEVLSDSCIYLDSGGQDIRKFLAKQAADREDAHGKNHWRAVLIRAMAEHSHLENWINPS